MCVFTVVLGFQNESRASNELGFQLNADSKYVMDSNVYRSNSSVVSDNYYAIAPFVGLLYHTDTLAFNSLYKGSFNNYTQLTDENSNSHFGGTQLEWKPTQYTGLKIAGDFTQTFDPRGSTLAGVDPNAPIYHWQASHGSAAAGIPTPIERVFINLNGGYTQQTYLESAATERDRSTIDYTAELAYAYSGKTDMVLSYTGIQTAYSETTSQANDNQLHRILTGVRWRATGKTSSHVLFGIENKLFNGALESSSFRGISGDVVINWRRKSYSLMRFILSRRTENFVTNGTNYYVDNKIGFSWDHMLTRNIGFLWSINLSYVDFSSGRSDTNFDTSFDLKHNLSRYFYYGLGVRYNSRNSSVSVASYDVNLINATIGLKY